MLHHRTLDHKALRRVRTARLAVEFLHRAALVADEELNAAILMAVIATDKGVQRLDLVDEAEPHQEIERAIDGWRLGRARSRLERFKQVIGLHRGVGFQDEFEHTAAHRGEFFPSRVAETFGLVEKRMGGVRAHLSEV